MSLSTSHASYRHVPDYDRCGWSTPWGCKQFIENGVDVSIVLNASEPEDAFDNGHRLFHTVCMPSNAIPVLQDPRWQNGSAIDLTTRRASAHRGILRAV